MNPLQGAQLSQVANLGVTANRAADAAEQPFKNLFLEALDHVNDMQKDADAAVEQLVTGEDINPAEVLTSIQKADMTFRMMLQIRNKLVQAYQEVRDIRI